MFNLLKGTVSRANWRRGLLSQLRFVQMVPGITQGAGIFYCCFTRDVFFAYGPRCSCDSLLCELQTALAHCAHQVDIKSDLPAGLPRIEFST